ncbi:hypothetical protein ACFYYR_16980 [Streptomyces sp. NPDC001922]|uniref:hypothetical protein n=1 Tax=Streptomyces sp. NPDC001922 TaxID=3364624 RepID=UPI003685B0A0
MGKDIVSDTERIKEFGSALSRIHKEFTKAANPADGYGVKDLGSQSVIDKFGEFSSNWKIHRERLTDELEKLAKIATEAGKSYQEIDSSLADALRGEDAKHKKSGTGKR